MVNGAEQGHQFASIIDQPVKNSRMTGYHDQVSSQ